MRDALSAFLHTDAWATLTGGTRDDAANIWTRHALPLGGHYWRCCRAYLPAGYKLPSFATDGWFVRIEPDSSESAAHIPTGSSTSSPAVQPRQTLVLDLTLPEETLLANFKQKQRYNLKLSEQAGLTYELLPADAPGVFDRFWHLLEGTAERHKIKTHAQEHYKKMIAAHAGTGRLRIGFVRQEETDIATLLLVICEGVATYLHGGSDHQYRSLNAPYLLQWRTMQQMKHEGCVHYDLWGVHVGADSNPVPGHSSQGTTRFKLGFQGRLVEYPVGRDIIMKKGPFRLYKLAQRVRRQRRFSE
jgi:lipid II:glycine glycyltransferase (peptidoglycan interpeptide bridge formation enzyme)